MEYVIIVAMFAVLLAFVVVLARDLLITSRRQTSLSEKVEDLQNKMSNLSLENVTLRDELQTASEMLFSLQGNLPPAHTMVTSEYLHDYVDAHVMLYHHRPVHHQVLKPLTWRG